MGEAEAGFAFPYHRGLAPPMWALFGLGMVEMLVVHGLVALWWPRVAMLLSVVSIGGLVWVGRLIRSFRRMPVTVSGDVLTMRVGRLRTVAVPVSAISGLRDAWSATDLKQQGVVNLGLLAYPNIVIDLDPPVAGRRAWPIRAIAHRLDDPAAFRGWVATLPPRGGLR
ncbi:MAG TPA: hypothetical protein VF649_08560 [Sphingomonas sp.]|uniref:hypothetical protein n=1 Tax=Sphingomonas sp. TaxID=28214 RepID=UPI002ED85CFF